MDVKGGIDIFNLTVLMSLPKQYQRLIGDKP